MKVQKFTRSITPFAYDFDEIRLVQSNHSKGYNHPGEKCNFVAILLEKSVIL